MMETTSLEENVTSAPEDQHSAVPFMEHRSASTARTGTRRGKRAWYNRPSVRLPLYFFGGMIILYFLMNDVVMPLYVRSGKVATVPNVVGKKQDLAVEILKAADYDPVQYEVRFDDSVPEGLIIRETPEAGEQTKPGRKVFLIISGGKEMAVVPDLRGKSLRDAKIALLKDNLNIGKTDVTFSDSTPSGIVFRQYPAPGIKITASTKVDIVVSQGPSVGRVPVPDLKGVQLADAIKKLNDLKLQVGNVSFQNTPEAVPGAVVEQYPSPGELVNEASTVDLFVVRDPAQKPGAK